MIRTIGGKKVFVAVISHKRPENMAPLKKVIGNFTVFVNRGEMEHYADLAWKVVTCGDNICAARNRAIEEAGKYPCIQVSDDLKRINYVTLPENGKGKRIVVPSTFDDAVDTLVTQLKMCGYFYGGVALTNNRMNYQGHYFTTDKLIVNDLICIMPRVRPLNFEIPLKEDYDMTIQQLLNVGGVVRCEQYLCDFPHRDNQGGANTYRNDNTEGRATELLKAKWGPLILNHRTRPGQVSLNYKLIREKREEITKLLGGGQ